MKKESIFSSQPIVIIEPNERILKKLFWFLSSWFLSGIVNMITRPGRKKPSYTTETKNITVVLSEFAEK